MNRIWQAYFGTGLVATSEDLGTQSEPPSHPELLDWLAVEFMDHGWSMKAMHRLIVTSATYRQSSHVTPELYQRDPYNRLLARGPRFRVDAEIVRDIALAASGLLNPRVGGPSVFPPAPAFLFLPPASYGPKIWNEATGADRYRRALYTFRYRSVPYPMLQTFDAPNGDMLLRAPRPLEHAAAGADHAERTAVRRSGARAGPANLAGRRPDRCAAPRLRFRRCLARKPTERGVGGVARTCCTNRQQRFADEQAKSVGTGRPNKPDQPPALPQGATPAQLAAWTAVSRVLLNLDETITKE